ncbi:MAG: acyl-[acyl-carrier-protein]--UDP-N-acetylglucosamine O-acyltransferase [Candidatus Melainabacteria bacterium RIFCSPHIGHO2_02_FULL_34_12]|nr:MAG: acyl-[acyl-carrier-protein]--UDP-N-acetylglucosamine O-acyltransferase [Candidatus Melainabacteria bacterium RIFCSPHIGHO2_02_FULL_34_12]
MPNLQELDLIDQAPSKIHPTAIISPEANIASGVEIGPYSVIGPEVEIKENTYIGPHVIIDGRVKIGRNCKLIAACSIGLAPQDLNYKGEPTGVKIGEGTVIREYVTIHRASKEGFTVIGKNCFLMNYVHIGHNVQLGNDVIMANSSMLPGYVVVEDFVFISGLSTIHQHCRIGESAIVGAMTGSRLDLPPYFIADGRPAKIRGVNKIGLRRRGIKADVREELSKAFKVIYLSGINMTNALEKIEKELVQFDEIKKLVNFYKTSKRGVVGIDSEKNDSTDTTGE